MPYDRLTPKQKRIVERDVETLFSPAAFLSKPTLEDIKPLGFFHPTVEYKGGMLFLSDRGDAALRRLQKTMCSLAEFAGCVSTREIGSQILKNYNDWLEKHLQPSGQEFIDIVADSLLLTVKERHCLILLEGLNLKDLNSIDLGSFRIQHSDAALLQDVKFGGNLDHTSIYDQFKDTLWLIGVAKGSKEVASEQHEYRAALTVGILALCGAILYRGAIWRSRVRAIISPLEHRKAISILTWERGGENPSLTRKWGDKQDLSFDSKSIEYLTKECFLKQLASLPDREDRSELQEAIVRSLYWFADAYRDLNPTMQFVKLWTCAECFFTINSEAVTDLNAKGLAVILAFAGFRIIDVSEYPSFKRRVKALYDLRSKALHRASFGHVQTKDLDDLSHWISWVIISMVALSERGFRTLRQIQEQISRLDRISLATNAR